MSENFYIFILVVITLFISKSLYVKINKYNNLTIRLTDKWNINKSNVRKITMTISIILVLLLTLLRIILNFDRMVFFFMLAIPLGMLFSFFESVLNEI